MRRSLRDADARRAILSRLSALSPNNTRRWGRMEPAQLLPHLANGLRMALGELTYDDTELPADSLRVALFRNLAIHVMPWPKGRVQAPPKTFSTASAGWDRDREILAALIEQFAAATPERFTKAHPAFGPMTMRDWDVLQYRHIDHHFRQFGA
ncbi:MAG: DinB family protein [bacterium]